MKKLRSLSLISIFGLILFSFVLAFTSCEVGLGSAVDTQAPTVSITYPPSLSIIKDSFVLAGTWTDDMGVKKSMSKFTRAATKAKSLFTQTRLQLAKMAAGPLSLIILTQQILLITTAGSSATETTKFRFRPKIMPSILRV